MRRQAELAAKRAEEERLRREQLERERLERERLRRQVCGSNTACPDHFESASSARPGVQPSEHLSSIGVGVDFRLGDRVFLAASKAHCLSRYA